MYKNLELSGELCVGGMNLGVISIWMVCKAKGIDEVTEILSDLMIIITIGPAATTVFGYYLGLKH